MQCATDVKIVNNSVYPLHFHLIFCWNKCLYLTESKHLEAGIYPFQSDKLICIGKFWNDYLFHLKEKRTMLYRIHHRVLEGMCMCSEKYKPITVGCGPAGVHMGRFMGPQAKLEMMWSHRYLVYYSLDLSQLNMDKKD